MGSTVAGGRGVGFSVKYVRPDGTNTWTRETTRDQALDVESVRGAMLHWSAPVDVPKERRNVFSVPVVVDWHSGYSTMRQDAWKFADPVFKTEYPDATIDEGE